MFGPKNGVYWVSSKKDPRFNKSWEKPGLVCWGTPDWVLEWIRNKAEELGLDKTPDDLTTGFHKH